MRWADRDARDPVWRHGLLWIVLLASAARVAMILVTPHFILFGDPADYQRHAISIAAGHGFPTSAIASPGTPSAFRPPAYPFLLGAVYWLVGVHPLAGRALGALLGVLAVVLMSHLARAVAGVRAGLIAGAVAAVFPPLVALNASLLSESLFLPVELAFALSLVALARHPGRLRWALLAGGLCGLAVLTRAAADALLLVALAAVVASVGGQRARWRSVGAVLLAFLVVLAPWTIRNLSAFGAFVPVTTEGGYTLAGQYNSTTATAGEGYQEVWRPPSQVPSLGAALAPLYRRAGGVNEVQLDSVLRDSGLRYFERHPGHLVLASAFDALRMVDLGSGRGYAAGLAYVEMSIPAWMQWLSTASAQVLVILALLVLLARAARRGRLDLGPWWLWAIPVAVLVVTIPVVGNPLKRVPLDPFLILIAAIGAAGVAEARQSRR